VGVFLEGVLMIVVWRSRAWLIRDGVHGLDHGFGLL
jgi:hypothetical protein